MVQAAAAFARAGAATTLLYARRRGTPPAADGDALWDHYAVPAGARPALGAVPCLDWIDRVPRSLQYPFARAQELSFARRAAREVRRSFAEAVVLSREIETARHLRRRPATFLEVHRVPGGALRRRWLREAAADCAGVIAISEGVRADLLGAGVDPARIVVEHDAFEPAAFARLPSRAEARERLHLPPERAVVVYAGGLMRWKGVDVLLDAAREGGLAQALIVIAGGMDADVALLRERARGRGNIRIDGFQPPARVPLYLAAADVGVVPNRASPAISARYTSPLKVFEAMAAGLPLVVSDLPSLRAILAEDQALFVPAEDPTALARGLAELLADEARRARLAERMREGAPGHTWDARAARLLNWMESRA